MKEKEYRAGKFNLGDDVFYISNFNFEDDGCINDDAYLMALSEVIEDIKKETSAEGLQIHPSCVDFIENKRPVISEDFIEFDDQYMAYRTGHRKYKPYYEPNHFILLKDNKDNYYYVGFERYFMYYNLHYVYYHDFVERDEDGKPVWEVFEFVTDIINNPLIDHNESMVFYKTFWWKKEKDIALEHLSRFEFYYTSNVRESEILNQWAGRVDISNINWIDLDRVA